MRINSYIALVVIFLHSIAATGSDCATEVKKNTFLWSVRHPSLSSRGFLFGTIHVPYTEVWSQVSDRVREAFAFSDTVLLEVNLSDESTVRKLIKCKNLKRRLTARSYLPPKLYSRIDTFMTSLRQNLPVIRHSISSNTTDSTKRVTEMYEGLTGSWNRKRPEWLLFLLYQLTENIVDRASTPMLDLFLAQRAMDEGKDIMSIETTEEQCNPIVSITDDEIIFAINFTTSYLEHLFSPDRKKIKRSRSISDLVQHYRCGSLVEDVFNGNDMTRYNENANIEDNIRAQEIDLKLRTDIITRRNLLMAQRLDKVLSTSDSSIIFSAIGTGHFFGENSIVNHLKDMDYIIEEVTDGDYLEPPRRIHSQQRFNSLWKREPVIDSVEIELISSASRLSLVTLSVLFILLRL